MVLDAVTLLGVLVPGDVAVLTAVSVGRFGRWIGARRWDAAERILQRGGGSMVLVARSTSAMPFPCPSRSS